VREVAFDVADVDAAYAELGGDYSSKSAAVMPSG